MKILIWHSGVEVLLNDAFTDANGTALASHAMNIGPGWTVIQGTFTVQDNKAQGGTATTHNLAAAEAGRNNVTVHGVGNTPSALQRMGLIARVVDAANYWWLYFDTNVNTIYLYEATGGVFTARASSALAYVANTDYALQVKVHGSRIEGTANGGNFMAYDSMTTHLAATKHGLGTYDVGGTIDNFKVTAP